VQARTRHWAGRSADYTIGMATQAGTNRYMSDESEATNPVESAYRKADPAKQGEFITRMLDGVRHERIRDFVVADGTQFKKESARSVIFHIPSGLWHGFTLSYEQAVERLRNTPEADEELLQMLFST
jgi:hypothetical protein